MDGSIIQLSHLSLQYKVWCDIKVYKFPLRKKIERRRTCLNRFEAINKNLHSITYGSKQNSTVIQLNLFRSTFN